jgi:hypothetical protein
VTWHCPLPAAELDSDHDGQITVKELKDALEECNIRWAGGLAGLTVVLVLSRERGV